MNKINHFKNLNNYYNRSKLGYDLFLDGAKHFGFYPIEERITEKKAQILMQELVAKNLNLKSKDICLDAGCGQGIVSTFLAKKYGSKIKGITMVNFEVSKAKKLASQLNVLKNTEYFLMNYTNTKFENNSFDCIYTMETLSHSQNIKKTLREFFRILKKEGRFAFFEYTVLFDKFSKYDKKVFNKICNGSAMVGLKDFNKDNFEKNLKNIGFKNIKIQDITKNTLPSLSRLAKYALLPYYSFVRPFGLQEKFPNISAAVEFNSMVKRGLIKYKIFTGKK